MKPCDQGAPLQTLRKPLDSFAAVAARVVAGWGQARQRSPLSHGEAAVVCEHHSRLLPRSLPASQTSYCND